MATLGELLLRYGGLPEVALQNFPRGAREAWAGAKKVGSALRSTALGGLQYAREMSPEAQRGNAPAFDKTNVDAVTKAATD